VSTVGLLFLDPRVERFLISDEGEVVVDEVRKHWAVLIVPVLEITASLAVLVIGQRVPPEAYWVPGIIATALALHGWWRVLQARMDRFVITNMRVFRVHGILTQSIATMPIARILDISVHIPLIGRILKYGHFVFESAAQEQGLREIRYVGRPNERGLTIQRVIQRSGLRGPIQPREFRQEPLAPPPPPKPVRDPVPASLSEPLYEPAPDPVAEIVAGPVYEPAPDPVTEILEQPAGAAVRPPKWPWGDPPRQSEPSWPTRPVPPIDSDDGAR
jgi:hypothetical protein